MNSFKLERSLNGATNWVEVAMLPVGTQSHTDQGLAAATQYFLSARGYKVKGIAHIALQWNQGDTVF